MTRHNGTRVLISLPEDFLKLIDSEADREKIKRDNQSPVYSGLIG